MIWLTEGENRSRDNVNAVTKFDFNPNAVARIAKHLIFFAVWGSSLFGILQMQSLNSDFGLPQGICGAWGCGPPLSALVAWHGFFVVLAAGPVLLAAQSWSRIWLNRVGGVLLMVGACAVTGVVAFEAFTWLPTVGPGQPSYFLQRCLFSLVTDFKDVPVIALTLAGVGLLIGARVRHGRTEWHSAQDGLQARHPRSPSQPGTTSPQNSSQPQSP